jgi:lipoic acid synthetase
MSDGLVRIGAPRDGAAAPRREPRPEWLRIKLATPAEYHKVRKLVGGLKLNTVCEEARCPNIYECWGTHGTATFMILGDVCTRRCGFCAVTSGRPPAGPDADEPAHVAEAVAAMRLQHAVITSVDRDDLPDGGARHWAAVIEAVHARNPDCTVEVLTPDFRGVPDALDVVLAARPEIFSHNTETVPRLYRPVRGPKSDFRWTLALLRRVKQRRPEIKTKSGLMLGLGETHDELFDTLAALRQAGCELLTLGQYLMPSSQLADHYLPVVRYVPPEEFQWLGDKARQLGFEQVASGPFVRSSYHAREMVEPAAR